MKLIVLVDNNCTESFEEMIESVDGRNLLIIETQNSRYEYKHLVDAIREFSQSSDEVMLGKFSGKEEILQELGDNNSEMIIGLSSNKDSINYVEDPCLMISGLIDLFSKEDALA